jgi:hypothetical protein
MGWSGDWLTQGWTSSPMSENMRHERHFMYALFGYMAGLYTCCAFS